MATRSLTAQVVEDTMASLVLDRLEMPKPRVLVVGAGDATIAVGLTTRGATVTAWDRVAGPGRRAAPWPEPGVFDEAVLRMPRARAAFEMALHGVAARLAFGGELWVVGSNEEGIRSAPARIEVLFDPVVTADARGHGRLFRARRKDDLTGLKADLGDWRSVGTVELPGGSRSWVGYPGLFAKGGLDAATALLLETLPTLPEACRVLDFGCGTGIIGAALEQRRDRFELDQLDADALAVQTARENLPWARTWLGYRTGDVPGPLGWDRVVSNPPIHEGVLRSYRVLEDLAAALDTRLAPAGEVWLVCQRQVPIREIFTKARFQTQIRAERGAFRVWQAFL